MNTAVTGTQSPASSTSSVFGITDAVQTFANGATGSCLDDSEHGLRGFGCNGGVYQKWNVHVWNDGTRQLRNLATNRCLYDDGVTLTTRACNSSKQQSWFINTSATPGAILLRNQASNECLNDSQYGLQTVLCFGWANQQAWL